VLPKADTLMVCAVKPVAWKGTLTIVRSGKTSATALFITKTRTRIGRKIPTVIARANEKCRWRRNKVSSPARPLIWG